MAAVQVRVFIQFYLSLVSQPCARFTHLNFTKVFHKFQLIYSSICSNMSVGWLAPYLYLLPSNPPLLKSGKIDVIIHFISVCLTRRKAITCRWNESVLATDTEMISNWGRTPPDWRPANGDENQTHGKFICLWMEMQKNLSNVYFSLHSLIGVYHISTSHTFSIAPRVNSKITF